MGKFTRITPIGKFTSPQTEEDFTLTLASLASGSGRQTNMITNSEDYPSALISIKIRSGTAPAAGRAYKIYLIRGTGTIRDDGAGASDAAITIENAPLLGTIIVTNTANKDFYAIIHTAEKGIGALGPEWGIAVVNDTDQALNSTEGNHFYGYTYMVPETDE